MKQALLNQQGEKAGDVQVSDKVFGLPWNPDLVHQAVVIAQGNQRQVSSRVKGRGEVRGGGRKPWRQKGTGRARHGSTRSPIWKGGGVTHGPTAERNYKRTLNAKMRKKALLAVLSEKLRSKQVVFLDFLALAAPKTKELAGILQRLPSGRKSTLLVLPAAEKNVLAASRNIPYLSVKEARNLSALDVAKASFVVLPKESLAVLEKTFAA